MWLGDGPGGTLADHVAGAVSSDPTVSRSAGVTVVVGPGQPASVYTDTWLPLAGVYGCSDHPAYRRSNARPASAHIRSSSAGQM